MLHKDAQQLADQGFYEEALQRLGLILAENPQDIQALTLSGDISLLCEKEVAALGFYARAAQVQPEVAAHWFKVAKGLARQKHFREALGMIEQGLRANPEAVCDEETLCDIWQGCEGWDALSLVKLGDALRRVKRHDLALDAYDKAGQQVDSGVIFYARGLALRALGRDHEALTAFDQAVVLGVRKARDERAILRLGLGDFEGHCEDYEARGQNGRWINEELLARWPFPIWQGPQSCARRVLVVATPRSEPGIREEFRTYGHGDVIQYCRFLSLMQSLGVEPYLFCHARLHRLLGPLVQGRVLDGVAEDMSFDAQIDLLSLPYVFKTRLDTIPADVPYLQAEEGLVKTWANVVGRDGFRIGCVWQCATVTGAIWRSFLAQDLAPLAAVSGVRLISLQHGEGCEQLNHVDFPIQRLPEGFDAGSDAFVDTAALMMSLDLIITCDTSVAHLAGALGCPVWMALPYCSEMRWMLGQKDTPWYPTMRIFRQKREGDWANVFQEMAAELRARSSAFIKR